MMRLPDHIPDPLISEARVEVERCKAAVADGSPRDFWRWRLGDYLSRLDAAAALIREQLAELKDDAAKDPT